jgi:hypothetical protein
MCLQSDQLNASDNSLIIHHIGKIFRQNPHGLKGGTWQVKHIICINWISNHELWLTVVITNYGYCGVASCCVYIINKAIMGPSNATILLLFRCYCHNMFRSYDHHQVTTIRDYHGNHNSWLLIQLRAIAVKQTACDNTPLSVAWWWSYDRNMLWQ